MAHMSPHIKCSSQVVFHCYYVSPCAKTVTTEFQTLDHKPQTVLGNEVWSSDFLMSVRRVS